MLTYAYLVLSTDSCMSSNLFLLVFKSPIHAIGGGPGLIAGVSGVLAAPIASLVAVHGPSAMGPTVALAAVIELAFGVARLGHLADHVTEPVIAGFLNAFSLFVIEKQVSLFVVCVCKYGLVLLVLGISVISCNFDGCY